MHCINTSINRKALFKLPLVILLLLLLILTLNHCTSGLKLPAPQEAVSATDNKQSRERTEFFEQGIALFNQGETAASLEYFLKALKSDESNAKSTKACLREDYRMAGKAYSVLEDYTSALEYLLKAEAMAPEAEEEELAEIYAELGEIYFYTGNYEQAESHLLQACIYAEKSRNSAVKAEGQYYLGILCYQYGKYEDAIAYLQDSIGLASSVNQAKQTARSHEILGDIYYALYIKEKSLEHYSKALHIYASHNYTEDVSFIYERLGRTYYAFDMYDPALENYIKALEIAEKINNPGVLPGCYYGIGSVFFIKGEYDKALEHYGKGCLLAERTGDKQFLSTILLGMGIIHEVWGEYDRALEHMEKALSLARELQSPNIADIIINIGTIYRNWGHYTKAWEYLQEAYATACHPADTRIQCTVLYHLGDISGLLDEKEKALAYYQESLALAEEYDFPVLIIKNMSTLGIEMEKRKEYDTAIRYFQKALSLAEKIANFSMMARDYINMGTLYYDQKQYEKALEYYKKSSEINTQYQISEHHNTDMYNLGATYLMLGDYARAEEYLSRGIEIIEKMRETARGVFRREYLESQVNTYRKLTAACISSNQPEKAFDTMELVSAKYLKEQLGANITGDGNFSPGALSEASSIAHYRKNIPPGQAILNYMDLGDGGIGVVAATKETIISRIIDAEKIINPLWDQYGKSAASAMDSRRSIIKAAIADDTRYVQLQDKSKLSLLINYYRELLSNPLAGSGELQRLKTIGTYLYNVFLEPVAGITRGKTELLIIPGGVIGLMPFETLVAPDAKYVIEEFHVQYAHSLAVNAFIETRKYSPGRRAILAFGGPLYDETTCDLPDDNPLLPVSPLKNDILLALGRGTPPGSIYTALGLDHLANLPGTYNEVKAIEKIFRDSCVYTGDLVTEKQVKELSETGVLKQFRVIHFATHAMAIPEVPELSALVLSRVAGETGAEDNYLTMSEITRLDINADFVNLSACETGLGKIYSGEGIVGLAQAFLIAGANGLSVSLWKIDDLATIDFMTGMYQLYKEKDISFRYALTEMKRRFIADPHHKHPFYWAAFVYYGI